MMPRAEDDRRPPLLNIRHGGFYNLYRFERQILGNDKLTERGNARRRPLIVSHP
jgi:hypothetical protein